VREAPVQMIDGEQAYRRLLGSLRDRGIREVALDFEGESNLHQYGLHLCLVQLFDGSVCYLIDPLHLEGPRSVAALTENDGILKVMYDPASDLSLLQNALKITLKNIFDLSTGAQVLGFRETSLTTVLAAELGVAPVNKKKFQRANWCRRPLARELLDYAARDVLYLLELKRVFLRRLLEEDRFTEFLVQNFRVQDRDYRIDPRTRYLRVKNARRLSPTQQVYLKHFFEAREELARRFNVPPHNVLANELLIRVSERPPGSPESWRKRLTGQRREIDPQVFLQAREAAAAELAGPARAAAGGVSPARRRRGSGKRRDDAADRPAGWPTGEKRKGSSGARDGGGRRR
jgi:ribonuclease D